MKSNFKRLGDYIREVDVRNEGCQVTNLLGLTINKTFIPSVANTIGTDMSKYKILLRDQFACSTMQVRRDGKMPIALLKDFKKAIISQAYPVFEVIDSNKLLPDYLMMWFSRPEFDREACFHAVGGVRGSLEWEDFLNFQLPVPSIKKQHEIVAEYNVVQKRIDLNNQLIQKLEETAQAVYNHILNSNKIKLKYRLGDLIEIKGGFSYNSENIGRGNSYLLGMGCVSFTERFVESGMRLYSDDIPSTHIVDVGDIIIATRQQSENMPILGFPAMIPSNLKGRRLVIASNLYRVVNKSKLSNEFIFQILKSNSYQNRIKEQIKGTTVGMITKDAIEDFIFEAPEETVLIRQQKKVNIIVSTIFTKKEETQKLTQLQLLMLSRLARLEGEN